MLCDEGDLKHLLDWLVKQHTCEWCDGTIDDYDAQLGVTRTPQRKWRNRQVKHGTYTSNHWKFWLLCRRCDGLHQFQRWIFPVMANMPQFEVLASLVNVQPMNEPAGEVFYAASRIRGERDRMVMLDDFTFNDDETRLPEIPMDLTFTLTHWQEEIINSTQALSEAIIANTPST